MAEKNPQAVFTPAGGMNQDDSIITPSPGAAGNSLFGAGDYRYALNARIGSSNKDNFGDLENIKDTQLVTSYNANVQLFENSEFDGSISGWSNLFGGTLWVYGDSSARIAATSGNILYQEVDMSSGNPYKLVYRYRFDDYASDTEFRVYYMNDTNVLTSTQISTKMVDSGTFELTVPDGCTRIGVSASGGVDALNLVNLYSLKLITIQEATPPSGVNKVIGRYEDVEFLKVYFFVWNDNEDHTIRVYDYTTDSVTEIIRWSGLKFQSTFFVKAAKLDNWMAFTDRNNRPRLIDVDSISDLILILGDDFREFHISFHKWAPVMPPIPKAYWDGSNNNYLKFENKALQFSYRYIYKGRLRSRWSPSSVVVENITDENKSTAYKEITSVKLSIPGFILDNPDASVEYNYFDHDDIKFTSAVEFIEIGYRESQLDLWKVAKSIKITDDANKKEFEYTGASNVTPISSDDFYQLFDTVPFVAGTVEAVDNRFFFGDTLNEHEAADEPIITDIGVFKWNAEAVDSRLTNFNYSANVVFQTITEFTSLSGSDSLDMGLRNLVTDLTFKSRGAYKVGIQFMDRNGWVSATYTTDNWIYFIDEDLSVPQGKNVFTFKIDNAYTPPSWAVAYQIVCTNCLNIDAFVFGVANKFYPLVDIGYKASPDLAPKDLRDRIFTHFQDSRAVTDRDFSSVVVDLSQNSVWRKLSADLRDTQESTHPMSKISRILIDINNWYNSSLVASEPTSGNNPMNNLYYNYRPGDRVRIIASDQLAPSANNLKVYDLLILEFTGNGIVVEKPEGVLWMPGLAVDATFSGGDIEDYKKTFVIEVYTPKIQSDQDFILYERGEWYPVLYPNSDDRNFAKRDWTYTNNNAVTATTFNDIRYFHKYPFTKGDCHFFVRRQYHNWGHRTQALPPPVLGTVGNNTDFGVCSMNQNPKETYGEWERGNGRPSIAYTEYPTQRFNPTNVRFGGKIIEQSLVNNLNRFRSDDQTTYPSEYGRIRDLVNTSNAQVESVGSILLAIGEREAWSIYINRTTLEDLSGRTQVSISDKVLGSYNSLLGSHGTLNPESITKWRGNVYYWDALDGSWVRYGRNGLTEVSQYKMKNWFREIGNLLIKEYQGDEKPRVVSGFDSFNDEFVTYINHSVLPATFRGYSKYKGATFSENDTRWKDVREYTPEFFASIGNLFISFLDGDVYKHEAAETYGTFYGEKRDVMVEPVFNPESTSNKHWQTITYLTTNKWSVERILSEYRGLKLPLESRITLEQFDLKEDTYWAAIKGDINTPNVSDPIVNGKRMASKAIQVMMKLDPTVTYLSLLHYVTSGYSDSPKNP